MQHFYKLFLFLLSLNFVTLTQNLQANSSAQQDWLVKQIDHPVFSQQDLNSGYPLRVAGYTVYVRGRVISGVPCLGTMFIK